MTPASFDILSKHITILIRLSPKHKDQLNNILKECKEDVNDFNVNSVCDFTEIEKRYIKKAVYLSHIDDENIYNAYYNLNHINTNIDISIHRELCFLVESKTYDHIITDEEKIYYVQNMRYDGLNTLKNETRRLLKLTFEKKIRDSKEFKTDRKRILEIINLFKNESK